MECEQSLWYLQLIRQDTGGDYALALPLQQGGGIS